MRFKVLAIVAFLFCPLLHAQMMPSYKMTKRYSVRELEEWMKKNIRPRFVSPADFNISAQMNTGWTNTHDVLGGVSQVGAAAGVAANSYNVGVNLDMDYSFGQAWVDTRISFKNSGGMFSGSTASFELSRAYIGYHFTASGPVVVDLNVGRRDLTKIYDSQLQYRGYSDGATMLLFYMPKEMVDIKAIAGVYAVRAKPYWIFRNGLYNIVKTGIYLDYTFTHWGDVRPNGATNDINMDYNISQFGVGWEYKPQILKKDIKVFAALLLNHKARINELSHGSKENTGGYVGLQFGNVKKQNDFSVQGQLQFCRLQAVPPWSMSGIGTGSAPNSIFTATSSANVNGNTNFKGWETIVNYAITDELTLTGKLQRSVPMNKAIGELFNYTSFKLETKYTF